MDVDLDLATRPSAIVADYMASLTAANREYRLHELKMSGRSPYSSGRRAKYSGDMPMWAFLELASFGGPIDLVRFCADRWDDRRLLVGHYDLKGVKSARNAAAHGSCLINCFARGTLPGARRPAASPEGLPLSRPEKWCTPLPEGASLPRMLRRPQPPVERLLDARQHALKVGGRGGRGLWRLPAWLQAPAVDEVRGPPATRRPGRSTPPPRA